MIMVLWSWKIMALFLETHRLVGKGGAQTHRGGLNGGWDGGGGERSERD